MEYAQLGKSELKVSRVILGTWALGGWKWGGLTGNEPEAAIRASLDRGINALDTAPMYGFGLSEELVRKAIKGRRNDVVIATKFGLRWDLEEGELRFETEDLEGRRFKVFKNGRKHSILEECDRSLKRLGVDVIDLYQCHWRDFTVPEEEMMEALLELRDKGKIRAFGVCNFDKPMMERCTAVAPLTSLQPPYSLLTRDIEAEIIPFCREQGIGVICYSPMYQGLLTGKIKPGHTFGDGDIREGNPWFKGEKLDSVNEVLAKVVTPIADSHDATPGQVAVAWCLAQPGITAAIVGARNAEQAESNVAAGDLRLSREELDTITEAFDRLLETE